MRQAVMISPGIIEFRNVRNPDKLKNNEILMRIKMIGICGSDIHVFHGKHPATSYPVIQGHEYSAVVEATGSDVTRVKRGMRVTARPQIVCGKCGPCKRGHYNVCQELKVQGFQAPGAAQELFVVPEDRVVVFPDSMTFENGTMIEPAAVAVHSLKRGPDLTGKNVVVSGAGTIGNLVAQFAKARGAAKILVTDISDYRLNIATQCGIEGTLNVSKSSFEKGVKSFFGDEGFQVGFETAGTQSSLDVVVQFIEKGGSIIIIGVYAQNPVINMFYLGEHELNILGSLMYRHEDYEIAVDMIASGNVNVMPLQTKKFPFEKFREAYKYIEEQGERSLKVIIEL